MPSLAPPSFCTGSTQTAAAHPPPTLQVDVDLSAEGHSQTVSRLQAALSLEPDGSFSLRCLGRRNLFVNGQRVEQGAAAVLPHLSLVKAGGVSLLFVANAAAVRRVLRRSAGVAI